MTPATLKHDVFQAIADPTRRQLLRLLADKEEPVVAITEHFSISRTAVNKHLAVLLDAGLMRSHKVGRETRYQSQLEPLIEVEEWLGYYEKYWENKLAALKRVVENQ